MALSARELVLILRAQNQASGALRRLANDMRGLGRIQELQLRRNAMAIQQANLMRQRQRALNELESVTRGRRFIAAQQESVRLLDQQTHLRRRLALTTSQLAVAEKELVRRTRVYGKTALTTRRAANSVQMLRDREMTLNEDLRRMPARLQANAERMGDLRRRSSLLSSELSVLNQRNAELAKRMRIVNKEISAARWDKAVFGARAIAHAGRIAQLAGLGLGAALGYAADFAARFEERATLVATQTGRVGSGFQTITKNADQLNKTLRTVLSDSTSSMEQLSDAAYDIFSSLTLPAGQRGLQAGAKMLKQFSDAAIGGMTDVQTVGEGVIAVLNAFEEFKPNAEDTRKILNRMFAAVRFGRMTFAEFSATLGTTAPAARAAGQSLDTMAGTIAFLSRPLGINKAAVGFARLTEIIGRKKFVEGLDKVGVSITDSSGKMLQLPEIIDRITKKFPELTKGGVKLVQFFKELSGTEGTIQARRAFVFLAQQMDQYRTVLGQTIKDNNEFDRSVQAMSQTTAVRWRKAVNSIKVLFIEIGAAVLPVLIQMLEPIQDLVKWFQNLDDETKDQIGRWLAWSAAILLVGGTLAAVVGTIGVIIAFLGRLGILFSSTTALIIAAAVAVKVLTGDFELLRDAGSRAMDFLTGSWEGFIVGAALAVAAILKVRNAMIGLSLAMSISRGGSAAAASGGLLPMLIGSGRNAKAGIKLMGEAAKNGSRVGAIFRVAAAGAMLLPGPLKLAAAAVGLFGVGALIWQKRAERMREEAEALAREQRELADAINTANKAAGRIADLGPGVTDFKRAKLDIADINAQIKELRRTLRGATGEDRAGIQRQIQRLILDRADAYGVMAKGASRATEALRGLSAFMGRQGNIMDQIARKQEEAKKLTAELNEELARPRARAVGRAGEEGLVSPQRVDELRKRIAQLNSQIMELQTGSQQATNTMVGAFSTAVRDLQRMGELPKGITQGMIQDVLALQVNLGRVLSRKQMKLVFKALVDPKSMAALPKQISSFLKRQRGQRIEVEAKIKLAREALTRMEGKEQARRGITFEAHMAQEKARKDVTNFLGWFKANKNLPPFIARVTPSGESLGVALAQGIQIGMGSVNLSKTINVQINRAMTDTRREQGIESPSKKWAKMIGLPLGQGVEMGFNEAMKEAGRNMRDRMIELRDSLRSTFFTGLGEISELRLEWGAMLSTRELTANLNEQTAKLKQYGRNWAELSRRRVPFKLLMQLNEMGEEGAAVMRALANSNNQELKAYVQAWQRAEALLNQISKRQLADQVRTWKRMGRSIAIGIMAGLRDEEQGLIAYFSRLFRRMYREAVKFNKSRSPSKRYEAEGRNIVAGLKRGISSGYGLNVPMPGMRPVGAGIRAAAMGGGVTMNVNATHSESLMTTLERARFRLKYR